MIGIARLTVLVVTMLGCVGCDQVTKAAARNYLGSGVVITFFHDTLRFQHTENPGAFLSLGGALPEGVRTLLFTAGGALLVVGAMIWSLRSRHMRVLQTMSPYCWALGCWYCPVRGVHVLECVDARKDA